MMAASRTHPRGSKRAGSEFDDDQPVAGPSSLHTLSEERPSKKSKQAESRLCPLCNKRIPLHMLAQHTEMELAKVNEVMHAKSPSVETGPSDPTASLRRPAAIRARASLTALAPTRRHSNPAPSLQTGSDLVFNMNATRQPRRTRHSIAMGPDSMVERRQRRVGGVCPVCEDDVAEGLEEHVDRCLQDAVLPHRAPPPPEARSPVVTRQEPLSPPRNEELVRVTDFTDFRGTGYDIRDRNIPDVDEDLDVDGDEDTVLYGESQFFEGDIIAGDDNSDRSSRQGRSMSPNSDDREPTRILRELVSAGKMVLTQRDIDVEGDEEDEKVSIASSADASMTWPPGDCCPSNDTLDNKDEQIAALMAQVKQLESALQHASASAPVTTQAKRRSMTSNEDAALTVCRICLDPFIEPVVSTGCWHLFCRECWLRSLGSTKYCPICKRITSTSNLRKVYM